MTHVKVSFKGRVDAGWQHANELKRVTNSQRTGKYCQQLSLRISQSGGKVGRL